MSEQEKFQKWWDECGFNSVILRAWMARAKFNESTSPQLDPHIALMEAEHKDRTQPHPAEDPDEWVILDPVKYADHVPRTGIDWFMNGKNEWVLQASSHDSRTVGDHFRWCDKHHRCRRRDLPKVEQAEQWPRVFRVTDGKRYFTCQSFRDRFVLIPEDCGVPFTTIELSWHNLRKCPAEDVRCEQPEQCIESFDCANGDHSDACPMATRKPQKTRVRLWARPDGGHIWFCHDKPANGAWQEIHYDADGFYVENKQ